MKLTSKALLLILGLVIFSSIDIYAQNTGGIRGFIYKESNGEPMPYCNVILKGTTYGDVSDNNGFFVISNVPAGDYQLYVTFVGYDSVLTDVTVEAGKIEDVKLFLNESSTVLGGYKVSADRQTDFTETKTSIIKVSPKQIEQIPSIGGQADLAQYLQLVPGVVFTGDQGGQLYIRGGSPIQNKVLLDGMIIYNPFHSIGLFSVFDNDLLQNADIYTGGFNSEFGGRISSIMDIRTRDGNKKEISGGINASTFGTKFLLEGPIRASKEKKRSSSSFIFSAKHSYLEETSKALYSYVNEDGLPFNFTDFYGKISLNADNGSKFNFFGFNFSDDVTYQALSRYSWNTSGFGANFIAIPASSPMLIEGNFAYSSYNTALEDQTSFPKESTIDGFNFGLHFTSTKGKNRNQYGIELLGFKTEFSLTNAANRIINQTENTTEMAFYWKYKWSKGKFIIEPGFRGHYYASLSEFSPEPRLALKYKPTKKLRLKLAAGMYSQNLIAANSDRDVVNLFYGFLSGTENLQKEFNGERVSSYLQKAKHLIVGVEIDITKYARLNVEGYFKSFDQLTNLNRNKIYDETDPDYADEPDYLKKDFVIEKGDAEGVDISFKYEYDRVNFWAVYSLGFIHRSEDLNGFLFEYVPHYDRRHNVNLLASYSLGKRKEMEFSVRWNYGSGFPFTPTAGFYEGLSFQDGINTDYIHQNGELGFFYGELNSSRLPDYHRLDVTFKRTFELSRKSLLDVVVSVTNLYSRDNIFYFDRIKHERVNQLPFLPSIGVNWKF